MGLSDYTGQSPGSVRDEAVVDRVSQHRRWDVDAPSEDTCVNCGTSLPLRERHLLVTLTDRRSRGGVRHHLCDEQCLDEWMQSDGRTD
jgi:hypothetical protein